MLVAACTARGLDDLNGIADGEALNLTFHAVPPVEMDQLPIAEGNVQTGGRGLAERTCLRCAVLKPRITRDDVCFIKYAVVQAD